MNKKDLINAVVEKTELSRVDITVAVIATFDIISEALVADEKVQIPGFGTFELKERPSRTYVDIHTRKRVTSVASKTPVFRPSKTLKDAVNQTE